MVDVSLCRQAVALLSGAKRIKVICHRNPDGDAIGSMTGIAGLLLEYLPNAVVEMYCVDPSPPSFHFLSSALQVRQDLEPAPGDAYVIVDSAEPKLTEFHERFPQIFTNEYPSVCFDHHRTNPRYATVNIVDESAASTCEIIASFADQLDWRISPEIATSLLLGVYTDTGGLLHSNTSATVYRTVARLLRAGARQSTIVQHVFRTAKVSTLRLWGRVLEKITITEEKGAISALTEGDFRSTGADYSELTGAIDYVNAIPGMRFSLILAERHGKVKGSIRTLQDDVDVSAMASAFQGGGHKKAAGFAVSGKLVPEVRWKVQQEDVSG
ncbi:MAG: DHH family phosphoesterase [Candidatus Peribacteraceae bacterium]